MTSGVRPLTRQEWDAALTAATDGYRRAVEAADAWAVEIDRLLAVRPTIPAPREPT